MHTCSQTLCKRVAVAVEPAERRSFRATKRNLHLSLGASDVADVADFFCKLPRLFTLP